MNKQRFAFLGLALTAVMFTAACEDKTEVVIPPEPDPPIVVNVVPDALTLNVGATGQLVASVTGGNAQTDRSVTWTSSNTAVATVDASGVVTAVSTGVSTVTATSVAEANARDASAITVSAQAEPVVSIKSITQFATTVPVQLNNVFGQIDITLNFENPPGSQVSSLSTYIEQGTNSVKVCEQTFSGTAAEAEVGDEAQGEVEIICSVNTAMYTGTPGTDAAAVVTFPNGPGYVVRVEVVRSTGTVAAEIESADMLFNNTNFVVAQRAEPTHCVNSAVSGLVWCEGNVVANLLPVMFSEPNGTVESLTLIASTGATATDSDKTDGFTVTLQKASTPGASSVSAVENPNVTFTVTSLTLGGQPGPTCVNPDPVLNPQPACGVTANVNAWVFAVPFRLDNVAPVVTRLDISPGGGIPNPPDSIGLGCNPDFNPAAPAPPTGCYISELFTFDPTTGPTQTVTQTIIGPASSQVPFFTMTDGGVMGQEVSFMGGPSGSLLAITTGGDLAESVTSNEYILQAILTDDLDNTRTVYASPTGLSQTSTSGAQTFGVDTTAPVMTFLAGVANNSTNPVLTSPAWTMAAVDTGVGPSGFLANPFRAQTERHVPAGRTCYLPDNMYMAPGNSTACTTSGGTDIYIADDGVVDVATGISAPAPAMTEGYWRLKIRAVDAAWPGNQSGDSILVTLVDVTAPVVGGISAPASLPGGQAATFTTPLADNVDLGWMSPFLTYAGGNGDFQWPTVTLGAYGIDDGLVGSATGTFNVPSFVRSFENVAGAGCAAPADAYAVCKADGTPDGATDVTFDVMDVAMNQTLATLNITAAVLFGAGGILPALGTATPGVPPVDSATFNPDSANWGNFNHYDASNPTVCDQPDPDDCGTNPETTVLRTTMTGPNATFQNPFTAVNFYYQDPIDGRWRLIGQGAAAASDNTVFSTRTWTYSYTWTVSGLVDANGDALSLGGPNMINVVAVGVHSSGSAIIGVMRVVTFADT